MSVAICGNRIDAKGCLLLRLLGLMVIQVSALFSGCWVSGGLGFRFVIISGVFWGGMTKLFKKPWFLHGLVTEQEVDLVSLPQIYLDKSMGTPLRSAWTDLLGHQPQYQVIEERWQFSW